MLEAQLSCLDGLGAAALNWQSTIAGANSPSAIVGHTHGVTAAFVLGVAGGEPWTRDRTAEFETRFASLDEVRGRTAALCEALASFAARDQLDLDELLLPAEAAWGSSPEAPMQRRRVVLEALRHASIHLGELRFTRSLIDAQRP